FNLVKQLIQCGLFDIVGHLDLIKKFGYYPKNGWEDIQEDVAKALGESGMVVEVNTSGMDKPVREFYPGANFLCRLRKYGVPVTLGSDAHSPDEVGRYFDQAVALLKEIGYTEIMSFEKRERKPVPL
ncbi:MAG: histidinol-phosphatase, partial [Candidatus Sumerlaeota bacterium]|nr:histidinol-phosphatase [Candidatus Sumerlaeota bacterium]